jgi:hypothetical protein
MHLQADHLSRLSEEMGTSLVDDRLVNCATQMVYMHCRVLNNSILVKRVDKKKHEEGYGQ